MDYSAAQSCLTLCDHMDFSMPGFLDHDVCHHLLEFAQSLLPSLVAYMVKNLPVIQETWVQSLGREVPQRKWQPTPVFTPGELHGQRSVEGYSQQYCK